MGYKLRVPCLLLALCGLWPLAARAAAPLLLVRNHTMAPFRFVAETLDATAWVTPGGVMAMRVIIKQSQVCGNRAGILPG